MSSLRFRSGGISRATTLRRKYKSIRNASCRTISANGRCVAAMIRTLTGIAKCSQRDHLAFLQASEQSSLRFRQKLADFVEKNGSPVRGTEKSQGVARGAGKRAANMAEELGFQQGVAER